jgi:hypothetical protein
MADESKVVEEKRVESEPGWVSADPSLIGVLVYEGPFASNETIQGKRYKIMQLIKKYASQGEVAELLALFE